MNSHAAKYKGLPITLWRYIAKHFFLTFLSVLGLLLALVYMFDTVELLNRISHREMVASVTALQMGFYKLPDVGQRIFPFAILFAGLITFWRLTRTSELVVARAAGVSAWQFTLPCIAVALAIALFKVTAINPTGTLLLARYEDWENRALHGQKDMIAFSDSGLWLREINDDDTEVVIHADTIDPNSWQLQNLMILYFDTKGGFLKRIDASNAHLISGKVWDIYNAVGSIVDQPNTEPAHLMLPTKLTPKRIEERFVSTETISFWDLPHFIKRIEKTGLSVKRLQLEYQSLIAEPLLFMSLVVLAAGFALRYQRTGAVMPLITLGLVTGFGTFFLRDLMHALAAANILPILLAAWTPAVLAFMLAVSMLLYLEDG